MDAALRFAKTEFVTSAEAKLSLHFGDWVNPRSVFIYYEAGAPSLSLHNYHRSITTTTPPHLDLWTSDPDVIWTHLAYSKLLYSWHQRCQIRFPERLLRLIKTCFHNPTTSRSRADNFATSRPGQQTPLQHGSQYTHSWRCCDAWCH